MKKRKDEDFTISVVTPQLDENTALITSSTDLSCREEQMLFAALEKYDQNKAQYSTVLKRDSASDTLSVDRIAELADGINYTLDKVLSANQYIRKYIHIDDILGATHTALQTNINANFRLTYSGGEGRNKQKQLERAKTAINTFNLSVRLKRLIRDAILGTATEGNYIMFLRIDGANAVIDTYPLGIAEISDYMVGGDPVVQINISKLEAKLKKTYEKDKKNKAVYFENIKKEIQANFPAEVFQAYEKKEKLCRLPVLFTGVLRINNLGDKYGVSHFFRALRPTVILENIENTDVINNKAKAKKIIHQKMRKEILGSDGTKKGFAETAHAHNELMQAWNNPTVVYTSIPAVELLSYVEPKVEGIPIEKIATYRNEKMTALGISYVDPQLSSVSAANITLKQLMKCIDSIAEQLGGILHRFYQVYLESLGIDPTYAPEINVLDSEQMEMAVKKDLVELMFSKLNLSYASCLEVLGRDVDDETAKRQAENEAGLDSVFTPRSSQYTTSNAGRPSGGDNPNKEEYDNESRKAKGTKS